MANGTSTLQTAGETDGRLTIAIPRQQHRAVKSTCYVSYKHTVALLTGSL